MSSGSSLQLDSAPLDSPADNVVLLDPDGAAIGEIARDVVHGRDTPLHLAFSCYVENEAGEVLITRRALGKRTWPGVWTNTCCGHPRPGEDMTDAIRRRLDDELGLAVGDLSCVLPDFAYTATDASGIVENEVCPVFWTRVPHPTPPFRANPDEVMDWKWVQWDDLATVVRGTPFVFSPWAVQQVNLLSALGHRGP